MDPIIIALVGAGSRSFGPQTVRDILLSEALTQTRIQLRLMDIVADNLSEIGRYAKSLVEKLGRDVEVSTTTAPEAALEGAQFVVTAVEVGRSFYWAQEAERFDWVARSCPLLLSSNIAHALRRRSQNFKHNGWTSHEWRISGED